MTNREWIDQLYYSTVLSLILPCFSVKICTRGIAMGLKSLINLTKRQGIGIDSFFFFWRLKNVHEGIERYWQSPFYGIFCH